MFYLHKIYVLSAAIVTGMKRNMNCFSVTMFECVSGAIPPLSQYAFTARCSVKAQGQLYLYLYLSRH